MWKQWPFPELIKKQFFHFFPPLTVLITRFGANPFFSYPFFYNISLPKMPFYDNNSSSTISPSISFQNKNKHEYGYVTKNRINELIKQTVIHIVQTCRNYWILSEWMLCLNNKKTKDIQNKIKYYNYFLKTPYFTITRNHNRKLRKCLPPKTDEPLNLKPDMAYLAEFFVYMTR